MGKLFSICRNTFIQTIRQPIYGVLILVTVAVLTLTLPLATWTVGGDYEYDDQKMLLGLGLGTLLLSALFISAFSAASALSREIEDKTALTVISKPVSRGTFMAGKFAGVTAAVVVAYYLCSLVFLMTVRHKVMSSAADMFDGPVIVLGCCALGITLLVATLGNIYFGWSFISSAVVTALVTLSMAMATISFVGKGWTVVPPGYDRPPAELFGLLRVELRRDDLKADVPIGASQPAGEINNIQKFAQAASNHRWSVQTSDPQQSMVKVKYPLGMTSQEAISDVLGWKDASDVIVDASSYVDPPLISGQLVLGLVLMLMAVLVLSAAAVVASTRLTEVLTLLIVFAVAVVGSMHDYVFGTGASVSPATIWLSHTLSPLVAGNVEKVPAMSLLAAMVPKLSYFYPMDALTADLRIPTQYVWTAGAYCALYVAALLAVGIVSFMRRELHATTTSQVRGAVGLLAWLGRAAAIVGALAAFVIFSVAGKLNALGWELAVFLTVMAVAMWLLWGSFARGRRWAYWLVGTASAVCLAGAVARAAGFAGSLAKHIRLDPHQAIVAAVIAGIVILVLALPGTRHHFRPERPQRRKVLAAGDSLGSSQEIGRQR
jgi:ABC-type transport system involved in multi-copper enzyme maturation permease subunit